jgi:hypothetical protein
MPITFNLFRSKSEYNVHHMRQVSLWQRQIAATLLWIQTSMYSNWVLCHGRDFTSTWSTPLILLNQAYTLQGLWSALTPNQILVSQQKSLITRIHEARER